MIRIDKSVFEAEEREQFEALLAKATVDPAAAKEEMEEEVPAFPPKKKTTQKAEVEEIVKAAIAETGASGMKEMGKVMAAVMPKTKGRADGKLVNTLVKKLLS